MKSLRKRKEDKKERRPINIGFCFYALETTPLMEVNKMGQNVEFIPNICEVIKHLTNDEIKDFVRYLIEEDLDVAFLNGDRT